MLNFKIIPGSIQNICQELLKETSAFFPILTTFSLISNDYNDTEALGAAGRLAVNVPRLEHPATSPHALINA